MNPKFKVLYIVAGTVAVLLIIYWLFIDPAPVYMPRIILNGVMALFFYYLAYKTYHEKKDKELM